MQPRRGPVAVTALLVAGSMVLLALHLAGVWALIPAVGVLAAAAFVVLPPAPRAVAAAWTWTLAGTCVAAAIGVFFRLRYLYVVPAGYNFEPLAFLFFALRLVEEGFPYIPYSWYAHTLYSYCIAVALLVAGDEMVAFRAASAALSLATLAALYLCLWRLFSARAAWIGTALLGASYWHLFASRNGYHQQLLPLFQLLFVYGIARGAETARIVPFAVAAVAMVLGLHSHWGFYLMPVFWLVWLIYLRAFHRERWRRSRTRTVLAVFAVMVALIPLARFYLQQPNVFDYIFKGFSPGATGSASVWGKIAGNLSFVAWALSGNRHAAAECGAITHPVVAAATLFGLVASLRWFAISPPYAAIVLLLLVNVAGLAITVGNYFYVVATLAPIYALAAIGISSWITEWEGRGRHAAATALALTFAAIGWQALANYDDFFHRRMLRELKAPFSPPGQFFPLLEHVRKRVDTRAVFVPRNEPGRDFDEQIFALGERVPSYAFVRDLKLFDASTLLFAPADVGAAEGVDLILPDVPFVDRILLPAYRRLYPNLVVDAILAPEPYLTHSRDPIARRVSIPRRDLAVYHGLGSAPEDPDSVIGFFAAPSDGEYEFSAAAGDAPSLLLHDRVVLARGATEAGPPVLLERGLHPLRLVGGGDRLGALRWRSGTPDWSPLAERSLHRGGQPADFFAPYLAAPGRRADFEYAVRLDLKATLPQDAVVLGDGTVVTAYAREIATYHHHGLPLRSTAVMAGDFRLEALGDVVAVIDATAHVRILQPEGDLLPRVSFGCARADVAAPDGLLTVLCDDGRVLSESGGAEIRLLDPTGGALMQPVNFAVEPDGFAVVDAASARLLRYDASGHLREHRILGHLDKESDVEFDAAGNLYVQLRDGGVRAYSPDGFLLFHPRSGLPFLFAGAGGRPMPTIGTSGLKFAGGGAVMVDWKHVYVYQRR